MSATSPDGPASVRTPHPLTDDETVDRLRARIDALIVDAPLVPPALNVSVTGSDPEHGVTLADLDALRSAANRIGIPPDSRIKAFARGGVVRRLETIPAPVPCAPRNLPTDDDA